LILVPSESNVCSLSTHRGAMQAKMERLSTQDERPARPTAERSGHLPARNPRVRLTIQVTYRAGAEAWWQLEARGRVFRFPGHICLQEALSALNGVR
jgi:hypothetical protein